MSRAEPALPTFFLIGAPKCGTTSLHHYLDEHPQISMTRVKEPQIFGDPDYRSRLPEYDGLLDPTARQRGESSTVYSMWPEVPERIASIVPSARLLYVVRDPIERIIAHYRQHVSDGKERRPLASALADLERPENIYVGASRYATLVRRYLASFPRSRLLIIDQGELLLQRKEALAAIFHFLDVDASPRLATLDRLLNTGEERRVATPLGRYLRATSVARMVRGSSLPQALRRPLGRLTTRQVRTPSLDARLRTRLVEHLRQEANWLREFSGRDFAHWST